MYLLEGDAFFGETFLTRLPGIYWTRTPESFLFVVVCVLTVGAKRYLVIEVLFVPEAPDRGLSPLPRESGLPRAPDPALEGGLLPCQGRLLLVMGLKVQCCCCFSYSMSRGSLSGSLWNS